jgi:hypothetical protein
MRHLWLDIGRGKYAAQYRACQGFSLEHKSLDVAKIDPVSEDVDNHR